MLVPERGSLLSMRGMGNQTCYAPDGSKTNDIPCGFPDSDQCCGSGWDCLENGLCRLHGTTSFAQGSCTNANYNTCLSFCNKSQFGGFTEVSSCGINSWCCAGDNGQDGGNCCGSTSVTTLQPFPYSTIAAGQVGPSGSVSGIAPQMTSAATKTSERTSSSTSTSTLSRTTHHNPTGTLSGDAKADQQDGSSNGGLTTDAKIGIGIAIPVGVLILAVLAFLIYSNVKQGRKLRQMAGDSKHIPEIQTDAMSEMAAGHTSTPQLENAPVGELEGSNFPAELVSPSYWYELDANE